MQAASRATKPTHEQQVLRLARKRTLLRARDLTEQGLPTVTLTRLVQAGKLERAGRGLYSLPDAPISEHRSLAEVSVRVPKGVVCLLSALEVHEIGTQAPFEVWIAIPQHMVSPRLDQPALRVVRMSDAALADGVDRLKIDGVSVPVFNAARTVVDCFRWRNKIGLDVALEALREGWRLRKFTLDDLWRHAQCGRVANVMRPYIEAITSWPGYSTTAPPGSRGGERVPRTGLPPHRRREPSPMVTELFDFSDPRSVDTWRAIDDRVMGGVSRSRLRHDRAGHAVFEGDVSLAQNGGFASVRSSPGERGMAGATTCLIEARGASKQFKLSLLTDDGFDSVNYQASFTTTGHDWQTISLPLSAFRASFRGRDVPGAPAFDPARIRQVGLLIAARQPGPFALDIRRIGLA